MSSSSSSDSSNAKRQLGSGKEDSHSDVPGALAQSATATTPQARALRSRVQAKLPLLQRSAEPQAAGESPSPTLRSAVSEVSGLFRTPISASSQPPSRSSSTTDNSAADANATEGKEESSLVGALQNSAYETSVAPQADIAAFIANSGSEHVPLADIARRLSWSSCREQQYGNLREFLQSYQSLFVVSPVDDTVGLRRYTDVGPPNAMGAASCASASVDGGYPHHQRVIVDRNFPALGSRTAPASCGAVSTLLNSGAKQGARRKTVEQAAVTPNTERAVDTRTQLVASNVGSISFSSVGEGLDLSMLATIYRGRGYDVSWSYDVLHCRAPCQRSPVTAVRGSEGGDGAACTFELFLFSTGGVVWWGLDRASHQVVEDDFLRADAKLRSAVTGAFAASVMDELYPLWCTYTTDTGGATVPVEEMRRGVAGGLTGAAQRGRRRGERAGSQETILRLQRQREQGLDEALRRFSSHLCYDHYIVPGWEPMREQVMLAVSFCLARSASVDYLELVTQSTHRRVTAIRGDFVNLTDYFSTKGTINRISGELLLAQLAIKTLRSTPDFLWEMPWLEPFCALTDAQYAPQRRLSWFTSRSDALLEQLANVKSRRFRLFMLGSDAFLIGLLILDVFFLTSRLVLKLYFKPSDE